jgi:ABC-type sugar transport system ATPase subunit
VHLTWSSEVFLLDEPLSNLDAQVRANTRTRATAFSTPMNFFDFDRLGK